MHTPFPGMDPYLEGHLWPDVHHSLASAIAELLTDQITPAYVARIEPYSVEDTNVAADAGIMYPDVALLYRKAKARRDEVHEPPSSAPPITPPTISIEVPIPVEVRVPVVAIRDRSSNRLITAIEILSPVNKREPGMEPYCRKRERLCTAGVHFLEIDLIRRSTRTMEHPEVPKAHYLVSLIRAESQTLTCWAFNVQDELPVVPVPLRVPDEDATLDLKKALELIYARNRYDLSVDYRQPPPPPAFGKDDSVWMANQIALIYARHG